MRLWDFFHENLISSLFSIQKIAVIGIKLESVSASMPMYKSSQYIGIWLQYKVSMVVT